MNAARAWIVLLGVLLASGASAAAPQAGSTIVGDREAAVGLYLDAWREERASDLDWPPIRQPEPLAPLDEGDVRRRIQLETTRDAVRRARLQSR